MKKKITKIIAQALIITMLIPNISTSAIENNSNAENNTLTESVEEKVTEEKIEDTTDEVIEDNNITENELNNEENQDNPQNTIVNEEVDEEPIEEPTIQNEEVVNEELSGSLYEELKDEHTIAAYSIPEEFEREEYRLKAKAIEEYTILKNKTDDNYEIALAYSDGSYRFVDSAESYEDALNIISTTPIEMSDDLVLPVIINSDGQVVYSTNSMARFLKTVNGQEHLKHNDSCYVNGTLRPTHPSETTNIYTNSSLNNAYTYINQNYVEDAPIIELNDAAAKIQVNGYTGWVKNNYKENDYNWTDIVVVPVNQVTNPSYYISEGGILYHYISYNLKGAANSNGTKIAIGAAPTYMTPGIRYLSYDGNYFYDGSNIVNGLNALINDLKAGHKNNSINRNNPHYNYYQYLPFRSKTIYSADQLNSFINSNTASNSKLRNIGQALKDAEKNYGVNALLTLGIAINESGWGTSSISQTKNNIFGLNAVDSNPGLAANEFPSVTACINDFSKNWISRGYADPADWRFYGGFVGNKNLGANVKYASDPFWGEKASKYAFQVDLELSGGINNLQDTNVYQLAMYTDANEVRNKNNTLLYKISKNFDNTASYVGVPFIITNPEVVNVNGRTSYEIYADRNTAVSEGKYHGSYNWSDKGYISASGVKLINNKRNVDPPVEVLGGVDRFETAVKLSQSKFTNANTVVIVNYTAIIDGVTASALATGLNAPILLATKDYVPESVKNEIKRLGATNVVFVGGSGILGQGVVNDLNSIGISNITRLGGYDRYDTALEVAKYIDSNIYDVSEVFLVYGNGEADALSAGAISGQNKMPILLTGTKSINSNVKSWLSNEGLKNGYIIGGTGVLSDNVLNELNTITTNNISGNRLGGRDRFDTNAQIIDRFYGNKLNNVYVAKGLVLVDALTAGPIAALNGSPIVIVHNDLSQSQRDVLSKRYTSKIIQSGLGVPQGAINSLRNILNIYDL